ncbi:nucleotide-binding protein [Sphingomonas sp. CFBP 8760]|nr:nucleotide-binding protein [Sphingomonas sp. CFBP 8760]
MIDRLAGDAGRRRRLDAIGVNKLVNGNKELANEISEKAELVEVQPGGKLIEQGADDNDLYLLLAGTVDVIVNGRHQAKRSAGDHVGEMSAIQPTQRRSADVVAVDEVVAAKLTEDDLADLGDRYSEIYRTIAKELARRLLQRNAGIGAYRDRIRVFVISSVGAISIAREIQNALDYDDFNVVVWTDGVFRATGYTLQTLEDEVDRADFAIAIAHPDDVTSDEKKTQEWPSPRDNVVFELGLFMGRLGRARALLMEPRGEKVKLPSDLAGVTTITYRFQEGHDAGAAMAPACNQLRKHMRELGPNNG